MAGSASESDRDDHSSAWDSDMDDIPLVMEDSEDEGAAARPQSSQSQDTKATGLPPGLPGFHLRLPLPSTSAEAHHSNNSSGSPATPSSHRQAGAALHVPQAVPHVASSSSHTQPVATTPAAGSAATCPKPPASTPPAPRVGSPEGGARGRPALRLHLTSSAAGASPAQSPRAAPAATSLVSAVAPGGTPASLVRSTGGGPQLASTGSGQQDLQVVLLLPAFTLSAPEGAPPGAPLTPAAVAEALRRQLGVQPSALQYYHLAAPGSLEAVLQVQQQQQASSCSTGGGEGHTPGGSHAQRPAGPQMQRQMSRLQQHSPSPRHVPASSSSSSSGAGASPTPATCGPQEQQGGAAPAPPLLPNVVAVSLPGSGFNLGSLEALLGQVAQLTARAKEAEEEAAAAERLMVRHQINLLASRHDKEYWMRETSAAHAAAKMEHQRYETLIEKYNRLEERYRLERRGGSRGTTPSPSEPGSAATTPTYAMHSRSNSFDAQDLQQPGSQQAGQQQQQQQQDSQQQQRPRPPAGPPAGTRSQPRTPSGSANSSSGGGRPPRGSSVPGGVGRGGSSGSTRSSSDTGSGGGSAGSSRRQSGASPSEQGCASVTAAAAALSRGAAASAVAASSAYPPAGAPLDTAAAGSPSSPAAAPFKGPAPGSLAADVRSGDSGLSYAAVAAASNAQASPPSKPNASLKAAGGTGGIAAGQRHQGGRARSSS